MDPSTRDRLIEIQHRLRAALDDCRLPDELAETARRCVIDVDCALATDIANGHGRTLLAQAQALITVASDGRSRGSDGDDDHG